MEKSKISKKIKRKNFFYYLGASALGVYSLSRYPIELLRSTFIKEDKPSTKDIKIELNPMAVKRDNQRTNNNG